jgi:PKHD-type hydroxylase
MDLKIIQESPQIMDIYTKQGVFTPDECKKIINIFTQNTDFAVLGAREQYSEKIRRSKIYWIPKEEKYSWIYMRIKDLASEVNSKFYNFTLEGVIEHIQYTEYSDEYNGCYEWHMDIGREKLSNMRKISISIQLSDPSEYEGGDLEINTGGLSKIASKNIGSATLFPPYLRHRAGEVTKGGRCVLVAWIAGPPFR